MIVCPNCRKAFESSTIPVHNCMVPEPSANEKLRSRLQQHDGCSRWGTKDYEVLSETEPK